MIHLTLGFAVLLVLISGYFYCSWIMPGRQYVEVGDEIIVGLPLPDVIKQNFNVFPLQPELNAVLSNGKGGSFWAGDHASLVASRPGQFEAEVKLWGFIPFKRMVVDVVAPRSVLPGGQSIGVMLHSEGVLVVGEAPVETRDGKKTPAKDMGIDVGDILITANQIRLTEERQLQQVVDQQGRQNKPVDLLVKHGNEMKTVTVRPVLCQETSSYRIGLFIKSDTDGVGTLTFYDPDTKSYGALGHLINNYTPDDQNNPHEGKIVEAAVKGLLPGKKGEPGEKMGVFNACNIMGTINKNTECGIFGYLEKEPDYNPYYAHPIPVALSYQVRKGPAEILTVLENNEIKKFAVQIEQVTPGGKNKGLVIKVMDQALIEKTGGIIQGMSGSPIIQRGKFVGAVTHVFINDPAKGYGVLAENMMREINSLNEATLPNNEGIEKKAS